MPIKKPQASFSAKSKKSKLLPPKKKPNAEVRKREYLTPAEVKRIKEVVRTGLGRHSHRNWLI